MQLDERAEQPGGRAKHHHEDCQAKEQVRGSRSHVLRSGPVVWLTSEVFRPDHRSDGFGIDQAIGAFLSHLDCARIVARLHPQMLPGARKRRAETLAVKRSAARASPLRDPGREFNGVSMGRTQRRVQFKPRLLNRSAQKAAARRRCRFEVVCEGAASELV